MVFHPGYSSRGGVTGKPFPALMVGASLGPCAAEKVRALALPDRPPVVLIMAVAPQQRPQRREMARSRHFGDSRWTRPHRSGTANRSSAGRLPSVSDPARSRSAWSSWWWCRSARRGRSRCGPAWGSSSRRVSLPRNALKPSVLTAADFFVACLALLHWRIRRLEPCRDGTNVPPRCGRYCGAPTILTTWDARPTITLPSSLCGPGRSRGRVPSGPPFLLVCPVAKWLCRC